MTPFHWYLALFSLFAWASMAVVYYWEKLIVWFANRFGRDASTKNLTPEQEVAIRQPIFERESGPGEPVG